MKTKKELLKLKKEIATLFYKSGLETPRRILPNIIFDWMTAEDCFKTRIRSLLMEMVQIKNYEINEEGLMITKNSDKPILITDYEKEKKAEKIKEIILKRTGIDVNKI